MPGRTDCQTLTPNTTAKREQEFLYFARADQHTTTTKLVHLSFCCCFPGLRPDVAVCRFVCARARAYTNASERERFLVGHASQFCAHAKPVDSILAASRRHIIEHNAKIEEVEFFILSFFHRFSFFFAMRTAEKKGLVRKVCKKDGPRFVCACVRVWHRWNLIRIIRRCRHNDWKLNGTYAQRLADWIEWLLWLTDLFDQLYLCMRASVGCRPEAAPRGRHMHAAYPIMSFPFECFPR